MGVNIQNYLHTVPLFHLLNVLDIHQLYEYNVGLAMFKYHQDMLPNVMDIFVRNRDVHDYSTRQAILLHLPKCRTELAKRYIHIYIYIIYLQESRVT